MLMDSDVLISQLENPPLNRRCSSGHFVKRDAIFKIGGPDTDGILVRFFDVSAKNNQTGKMEYRGTYCEPCLVLSRYLINKQKEQEQD